MELIELNMYSDQGRAGLKFEFAYRFRFLPRNGDTIETDDGEFVFIRIHWEKDGPIGIVRKHGLVPA